MSELTAFMTRNVDGLRRHRSARTCGSFRLSDLSLAIMQKGKVQSAEVVSSDSIKLLATAWQSVYYCASITLHSSHHFVSGMASAEESSSSSFRTPGSVPFKWELRPGIPKEPEDHGADLPASASSSLQLPPRLAMPPAAATASPSLQLPPRLTLPPSGASSSRMASSGGAHGLASVSSMRWGCAPVPSTATPRHRRSMSARFATSLAFPFTGPRWRGRSKDEDDVAFAAIYGDKIVS